MNHSTSQHGSARHLRVGDWVQVKSAAEILATLDDRQALDGMPFMPEMLQYCGHKFRVLKVAHKTCDTINEYSIRTVSSAVHLDSLRCDGKAHGKCDAGCMLFWKEAWLRRTTPPSGEPVADNPVDLAQHARLLNGAHSPNQDGNPVRYRCQATDLYAFTRPVRRRDRWNPLFYVRDVTSGNVSLRGFVMYGLLAIVNAFTHRWFMRRYPVIRGQACTGRTPHATANLAAGDLVRVKSKQEIMQTLDANQRNRGLFFDVEMVPYCDGGPYRVLRRVERIVDEKTGALIKLPNACHVLDGVSCGGHLSMNRMFCPRQVFPFWRETWLEKTAEVAPPVDGTLTRVTS